MILRPNPSVDSLLQASFLSDTPHVRLYSLVVVFAQRWSVICHRQDHHAIRGLELGEAFVGCLLLTLRLQKKNASVLGPRSYFGRGIGLRVPIGLRVWIGSMVDRFQGVQGLVFVVH